MQKRQKARWPVLVRRGLIPSINSSTDILPKPTHAYLLTPISLVCTELYQKETSTRLTTDNFSGLIKVDKLLWESCFPICSNFTAETRSRISHVAQLP